MKSEKSSAGIGTASLLTIVFVVLKLTNVISWKWIWVLSPLWIEFAVAVILLIIIEVFDLWW